MGRNGADCGEVEARGDSAHPFPRALAHTQANIYTHIHTNAHSNTAQSQHKCSHWHNYTHIAHTNNTQTHTHSYTQIQSQKYAQYLHRKVCTHIYTHPQCALLHTKIQTHIQIHPQAHTDMLSQMHIYTHKPHTHPTSHNRHMHTFTLNILIHNTNYTQKHTHTQSIFTHTVINTHTGKHTLKYTNTINMNTYTHEHTNKFAQKYAHILIHKNSQTYGYIFMGIIHFPKPTHTENILLCYIHALTLIHEWVSMAGGGVTKWLCIMATLTFPCILALLYFKQEWSATPLFPGRYQMLLALEGRKNNFLFNLLCSSGLSKN